MPLDNISKYFLLTLTEFSNGESKSFVPGLSLTYSPEGEGEDGTHPNYQYRTFKDNGVVVNNGMRGYSGTKARWTFEIEGFEAGHYRAYAYYYDRQQYSSFRLVITDTLAEAEQTRNINHVFCSFAQDTNNSTNSLS